MTTRKIGPWRKTRRILAATPIQLSRAVDRVVLQEAQFFRTRVVRGFRSQAPGGKKFKPPSENTIKIRRFLGFGGTKALIVRSDLRNSVKVHRTGRGSAFVGVRRGARGKKGQDLVNVARVHEFGAGPIVIRITDKMRRFLGAAGVLGQGGGGGGGGGGGVGIIVVRIPARPFLRPVFEKHMIGAEANRRVLWRISRALNLDLGTPSGGAPSATG